VIRFAHGAATDVGRIRSLNEDNLLVAESLFAVADGMGGHRGGEVASAEALESLRTSVLEPDAAALRSAVETANRAVFEHSLVDPELSGMGTTLCAVALVRDDDGAASIAVVNVGDSRVYLLSDGDFRQITEDHSLVETMVRGGQLSPDEAAVHPGRNVLTRALGIEPEIEVDLFAEPVRSGDRFLLCSDGLFNELQDDQIAAVLRRLDAPGDVADELVRMATEAGGRDNVTAVIVDVLDDEADGRRARRSTDGGASDGPSTAGGDGHAGERTEQYPAVDVASAAPTDAASAESPPLEGARTETASRESGRGDAARITPGARPGSDAVPTPKVHSSVTWRVWAFVAAVVVVIVAAIVAVVVLGR
jgi:protein phosphatase